MDLLFTAFSSGNKVNSSKFELFCSEIKKSLKYTLQTVTNLRTLRAVKIATIAIGICLGVDSIILGISNEQTGNLHFGVFNRKNRRMLT